VHSPEKGLLKDRGYSPNRRDRASSETGRASCSGSNVLYVVRRNLRKKNALREGADQAFTVCGKEEGFGCKSTEEGPQRGEPASHWEFLIWKRGAWEASSSKNGDKNTETDASKGGGEKIPLSLLPGGVPRPVSGKRQLKQETSKNGENAPFPAQNRGAVLGERKRVAS